MDAIHEIDLPMEGENTLDYQLKKQTNAEALSDSLTASAHLTALSWGAPGTRAAFISQCNYCHQVGNELTRGSRDQDAWKETVRRMEGYLALLTNRWCILIARFEGSTMGQILHGCATTTKAVRRAIQNSQEPSLSATFGR
jgi:hypothetical protein